MPLVFGPVLQDEHAKTPLYHYDNLVIVSKNHRHDFVGEKDVFDNQVVATFGPDKLTADHLEVYSAPDQCKAYASGHVVLVDPDGSLVADDVQFSWNPLNRYAIADHVIARVAGATIRARHADVRPGVWKFTDFYFTSDRASNPLYSVDGRSATVYPGHRLRLEDPRLSIYGVHVLSLPTENYSLDPRATGLRPPNIEYRGGAGFGYNWNFGFVSGKQYEIEGHTDAYPGSLPGNGIQLTRTFIPADQSRTIVAPKAEFGQRFDYGFFDDVLVPSPESEVRRLEEPRQAVSFLTQFNGGVSGRGDGNETFSIPAGFNYERGGKIDGMEALADARLETISRDGDPIVTRGIVSGSLELPEVKFSDRWVNISRIDASGFMSDKTFGWARASTGITYRPTNYLAFSAGAFAAIQGGTPDFDIDPLYYLNGFVARADFALGPRRFSYLVRNDSRLGWFDTEYVFTQAVGPLQAYVIYRRYPGDTRYGLTLRLDQFEDLLTRRTYKKGTTSTIDSGAYSP